MMEMSGVIEADNTSATKDVGLSIYYVMGTVMDFSTKPNDGTTIFFFELDDEDVDEKVMILGRIAEIMQGD